MPALSCHAIVMLGDGSPHSEPLNPGSFSVRFILVSLMLLTLAIGTFPEPVTEAISDLGQKALSQSTSGTFLVGLMPYPSR